MDAKDSGMEDSEDIVSRDIDQRAVPSGNLYVAQLKGRVLPVAAALFANAIVKALELRYATPVEEPEVPTPGIGRKKKK